MNLSTTTENSVPSTARNQAPGNIPTLGSVSVILLVVLASVGLAAAFAWGAIPKLQKQRGLKTAAAESAANRPTVNVVTPRRNPPQAERTFPGNAQPFYQADIYARTNGYLKRRLVDIGDRVEAGQLLAEIEAPDVDAQLLQAQATVLQARASLVRAQADEVFAQQEEDRYRKLFAAKAGTQEDFQNKVALSKVATANMGATQAMIDADVADVQRLAALQSFQKLTAPFAGVITVRNIDAGALITADNPSSEQLLFRLVATDPLRVFVDIPQVYATAIKVGQPATIIRREDPSHQYLGQVTRTASALDDTTRTLRTQIQVPNADGALLPGMYLQVKLTIDQDATTFLVPTAALVTRTNGPTLAVLDKGDVVKYRPVQLGRDYGAEIEILSGLNDQESVILHPGDDLPEGTLVTPLNSAARDQSHEEPRRGS